mmetsp:Transcript_20415/g.58583  ORF Transcript_20415/g.58583 Transcript_20415/m.58583 type:complete len:235 (-) Transcript_20415:645-1349(-)
MAKFCVAIHGVVPHISHPRPFLGKMLCMLLGLSNLLRPAFVIVGMLLPSSGRRGEHRRYRFRIHQTDGLMPDGPIAIGPIVQRRLAFYLSWILINVPITISSIGRHRLALVLAWHLFAPSNLGPGRCLRFRRPCMEEIIFSTTAFSTTIWFCRGQARTFLFGQRADGTHSPIGLDGGKAWERTWRPWHDIIRRRCVWIGIVQRTLETLGIIKAAYVAIQQATMQTSLSWLGRRG